MNKIFFLLFFLSACAQTKKEIRLCPKIVLHAKDKIDFTDAEKRLVCGDPEVAAYKNIPAYQAKYSLQGFLESKGYVRPDFLQVDDVLHVYANDEVKLSKVEVKSERKKDSEDLERDVYRHHKHEAFSPSFLNDLEKESKTFMRNRGYPCAKISSKANVDDGTVFLEANDLQLHQFGKINKEQIPGVDERALDRFYPFKAEDYFSERELNLAEKRFVRSGVVQGTFFQEKCDPKQETFSLGQQFIVGPPHVIRFGAGASTEVGLMARAKWSNQRYGNSASLLEASIEASFRSQSLKLTSDQYFWIVHPRQSLLTEFIIVRNSLADYREILTTLSPHVKWTNDRSGRFWLWSIGPTVFKGSYKTDAVTSNKNYTTGAVEGVLKTQTHAYEFYDDHPQEGDTTEFHFDYRNPTFGFEDPLLKLDLNASKFFWIGNSGKGSLILGGNLSAGVTSVKRSTELANLPPSVKFYGGGSMDVRGFELATLPDNGGLGALTKAGLKLEFRRTHFFSEKFEGFTFIDMARLGTRSFKLDPRLWYSPGIGVRWFSPIGLVETFLARSLSSRSSRTMKEDEGLRFFVGLGGTF